MIVGRGIGSSGKKFFQMKRFDVKSVVACVKILLREMFVSVLIDCSTHFVSYFFADCQTAFEVSAS